MICPRCGHTNTEGEELCVRCGNTLLPGGSFVQERRWVSAVFLTSRGSPSMRWPTHWRIPGRLPILPCRWPRVMCGSTGVTSISFLATVSWQCLGCPAARNQMLGRLWRRHRLWWPRVPAWAGWGSQRTGFADTAGRGIGGRSDRAGAGHQPFTTIIAGCSSR